MMLEINNIKKRCVNKLMGYEFLKFTLITLLSLFIIADIILFYMIYRLRANSYSEIEDTV